MFTAAVEELTAYLAQVTDRTTVSRVLGISWQAVGSIVERVVAQRLDERRFDAAHRGQPPLLARLEPLRVLQQAIARPLERLGRLRVRAPLLRPPNFVHGLRSEAFHVKAVEDHPRVRNPRSQRFLPARRHTTRRRSWSTTIVR